MIKMVKPFIKPNTVRDASYLAFIRSLPCIHCGKNRMVAPHHEGDRGMGIKASDFSTLPLCFHCHGERHQVGKTIWLLWDMDPEREIERLKELWSKRT